MNLRTTFKSRPTFNALLFVSIILSVISVNAQSISFGSSGLVGESIVNPTSLEFGPDDRLYVSQQDGSIWAFTITRDAASAGNGTYTATNSEIITAVKNGVPNHNDQGNANPILQRQVTGILTAGTATNPILYVTSSDYLTGGGGAGADTNLDTNSGVLSRLTWDGSQWLKVDLVRGLPRCEENHAINGMDMFERNGNTYLLVNQGGHTNKGAPSNNFAGTPEYFLSGSMLIMDLTQLESMPIYNDPRSNTDYVYDLPTFNDPTRNDIDNTNPSFPYPSGHPMYNATIDIGDPFGGNNGLNQGMPEAGGPVQVFAPGFRNAYDVVITQNGKIYTSDNGPNSLWGGFPRIYSLADDSYLGDETTIAYDPALHYIKNDFNENGSDIHGDPLHYVGTINDANGTYYGGHPIPILAFPNRADIVLYEKISGTWTETRRETLSDLLINSSGYFDTSITIGDFPEQPTLGEYLLDEPVTSTKVNILEVLDSSTNGIVEYTSANTFGGQMQGNILTASFGGAINRYVLNAAGDGYTFREDLFSGFGNIPLDVTTQGDGEIFEGTVWAATYGSNAITVFEPADINCLQPSDVGYDPMADYDMDGFTNDDEIQNGTNHCSQGSKPNDNDGDFLSDLLDDDDDNDTILDVNDAFAIDPNNGLTTNLPIDYPFWNNDPNTGFFGLGFTGLMLDPDGTTDYLDQFDVDDLSFGGAAGKATVDVVTGGDAYLNNNDQENAFQFGINVDSNSNPFTVHSRIESPYFGISGAPTNPIDFQSYGISIGNGDMDNYLKIALMNGNTTAGLQVVLEDAGVITNDVTTEVTDILNSGAVDLYFTINPSANTAQPYYSLDNGSTLVLLGSPLTLPASFLDPNDNQGLAVTMISTSRGSVSPTPFTATWDFMEVSENQNGVITADPSPLDFGLTTINSTVRTKFITLTNEGGPTDSTITINTLNITGSDASLFSSDITLPFDIGPGNTVKVPIQFSSDQTLGDKSATVEFTHSGNNSPIAVSLSGNLTDTYAPIARVNAGGTTIPATDGGPDWELNNVGNFYAGDSYSVDGGNPYSDTIDFSDRDASIPNYIDEDTYLNLFTTERSNEYIFSFPVANGDYIVNLFVANIFSGTQNVGDRLFNVNVEGTQEVAALDLIETYGHKVGGMIQINTTVNDGSLDIETLLLVDNPLLNGIEILAVEFPDCLQPGDIGYDPMADNDADGYSNQEEIDNNTNICKASSTPRDTDGDLISNLYDTDDDDDSILDVNDIFALDINNGTTTNLPVSYSFDNTTQGAEIFDDGFTGLMLDLSGSTDYLSQFNRNNLFYNAVAGKLIIGEVTNGDAFTTNNNQDNGFQFGINVDSNSNPFTVHSKLNAPFFSSNLPQDFQSFGMSIGNGDQDNYLKFVLTNGTSDDAGLQILLEDGGTVTLDVTTDITDILLATSVDLYLSVDPSLNTAQAAYSLNNGETITLLGAPTALPTSFLNASDNQGLAVGLLSTSRGATPFEAVWDLIEVTENQDGVLASSPAGIDFELTPITNSVRTKFITLSNEGGPDDSVITINAINFSGTDASYFSSPVTLPFDVSPNTAIDIPIYFASDPAVGVKNATVEFVHSGTNPSVSNTLTGELTDIFEPLARVNAGGDLITATDSGPDWELNNIDNFYSGTSFTVDAGGEYSILVQDIDYSLRHITIPNYIDQTTYESIFTSERGNDAAMTYTFPVPDGDYIVNLYLTNIFSGTQNPDQRIFSVDIEGVREIDNIDLIERFGYRIGGMVQVNTSVSDGNIDITFIKNIENPIVNGIEILSVQNFPPITIDPITDQTNCVGQNADFAVAASGGNPSANLTYAISGQPSGVMIEPTNGLISGVIDVGADTGGPNSDGIYNVTVTVSKSGSMDAIENFTWTVNEASLCTSVVSAKVMLQGALLNPNAGEETLMRDDLRTASLIPTTSPYADALVAAVTVFNTGGTSGTGLIDDDIVDWVYVELRDATTNTTIIEGRSALLQRDGDVVDIDGLSSVTFNQDPDDYYVVIKHRNHLGVMTASTFALSSTTTIVDFTDANNQITHGTNAQTIIGMPTNVIGMWTGDTNISGVSKFSGSGSSVGAIKDYVLADPGNGFGSVTYNATGYLIQDIDLNGVAKFSGAGSDTAIIKDNVLAHPGNGFGSVTYTINGTVPEN